MFHWSSLFLIFLIAKNPRIRPAKPRMNFHTLESRNLISFHPRTRICPKADKILDRKDKMSSIGHFSLPLQFLLPPQVLVLLDR